VAVINLALSIEAPMLDEFSSWSSFESLAVQMSEDIPGQALGCDITGAEMAGERIALGPESLTIPGQEIDIPTAEALAGLSGR